MNDWRKLFECIQVGPSRPAMTHLEKLNILEACMPGAVAKHLSSKAQNVRGLPPPRMQPMVDAYIKFRGIIRCPITEILDEYEMYIFRVAIDFLWAYFIEAEKEMFALPDDLDAI